MARIPNNLSSSQSSTMRALGQASGLGGGLGVTLPQLARGDLLDGKIRAIQQQAERTGWSPNDRQLISEMRKYQQAGAQDTRAGGGITIATGGARRGGGGGGQEGKSNMAGDPLSFLAQLLGQSSSTIAREQETGFMRPGAMQEISAERARYAELKPLMDQLMEQEKLKSQAMRMQLQGSRRSGGSGSGGGADVSLVGRPRQSGGLTYRSPEQEPERPAEDPWARVRAQAVAAALRNIRGM